MAISPNLFLAILSMDSYNRGYNAGVSDGGENDTDGLGETKDVSRIGNSKISYTLADADLLDESKSAGFYAIAYEITDDSIEGLANGQKVISYRGTDNPGIWSNLNPWSTTPGGDAWNGWSVGAGACIEQVS